MAKILVIEDEIPLALMMVFLLSRVGYDVTVGRDGQEGLELAGAALASRAAAAFAVRRDFEDFSFSAPCDKKMLRKHAIRPSKV